MAGRQTPATLVLRRAGTAHSVHSYRPEVGNTTFGEAAADALGVPADRVFKTLIVTVDGVLACAVVPVTGNLDLKAMATALGGKRAAMADLAVAERSTGYVRGGMSPFGQRRQLPTVLDESAAAADTIFVSAGRRGLELELRPADLLELTDGLLARIAG